jgi:uncharacterized protein YjbI with pentapeptide repeats
MDSITQEELNEVIRKHGLWLKDDPKGEKADLSFMYLRGLDFSNANLQCAVLHGADLKNADLRKTKFMSANLELANLSSADLRLASLGGANLGDAYLKDANLEGANLGGVNLWRANLKGANLCRAILRGADLRYARLYETNLQGADIDFSGIPLWCGSLKLKIDKRIASQLIYHVCSMECDDEEFIALRNSMINFANRFHRIYTGDCNKLKEIPLPSKK